MADAVTIISLLASGGVATWLGNMGMEWLKSRSKMAEQRAQGDVDLEKHRDNLTFQLLEAARTEISALRVEITRLRPMEGHLIHFEEALLHIEALLMAHTDPEAREIAERNALAFLNRMRRGAEALGTIANAAQRQSARVELIDKGVDPDTLKGM